MPCFSSFSMAAVSSPLEVWVKSRRKMYPVSGPIMKA